MECDKAQRQEEAARTAQVSAEAKAITLEKQVQARQEEVMRRHHNYHRDTYWMDRVM